MKLFYSDVLQPRKVCALARYLGSPVEFVYLDLSKGEHRTPAYLAVNPNGKVPTLTWGDHSLWEADAILCELARRADSPLWPQDSRQIQVIRWLSWNAHHFIRAGGALYFQYVIKARFGLGAPDPAEVAAAQTDFTTHATVLEGHLAERKWLLGDDLTIADFSVAVTLPFAQTAHMPLDSFPAIRRWHDQLNAFPAWRDPFPQHARDAA